MAEPQNPPRLDGAIALVTGASRGIGAQTAVALAAKGATVVVNYREKRKRADQIVEQIRANGGAAAALGGDVTDEADRARLISKIREQYGSLDLLILNASGGLEPGAAADYPMLINRDAQTRLLEQALAIMPRGSRVVFVTSHQAHFYPHKPVPEQYKPIAESKRAGEDAVLARIPALERQGVSLVVVSGDMIEGTTMVMLLGRRNPEEVEARKTAAGGLPTVEEFAAEIVAEAEAHVPNGHVRYVGGADWVEELAGGS
ncbi:short-chain dehydrogenase/reductase SDR [Segniliparus rotundus DSM 44985]|uniref:Short-chain dehydrogenase/reductase SDR n=1 Tax=Segniliparus rotundus (strain ATCC BAA-972 / CDC 1076 / CIP 108378 / DSM 44985 / JCM 13578) TaxID=640132 RepID=D6Z7V8_SEGRD|nr:SDR family oxidoreductase [Segniliparus rotundus]ADG98038.1 short-chain dehydrogenase/reductase SDR [Segniliparus rotundus DSM 44985]